MTSRGASVLSSRLPPDFKHAVRSLRWTSKTIYRETPAPKNPIGAKGVGETGTIPAAAAVISAVENALTPFGVRISQTPIVPEALFNLIEKGRAGMAAQEGVHP